MARGIRQWSGVLGLAWCAFAASAKSNGVEELSPAAQRAVRAMGRSVCTEETSCFRIYASRQQDAVWAADIAEKLFNLIDRRIRDGRHPGEGHPVAKMMVFILPEPAWKNLAGNSGLRADGSGMQFGRECFVLFTRDRGELAWRIAHEIAHERIRHYYGKMLPVWLEEGMAGMCGWDAAAAVRRASGWTLRRPQSEAESGPGCTAEDITRWSSEYPSDADEAAQFARCAELLVRALLEQLGCRNFGEFLRAAAALADPWDVILRNRFGFAERDFERLNSLMSELHDGSRP